MNYSLEFFKNSNRRNAVSSDILGGICLVNYEF